MALWYEVLMEKIGVAIREMAEGISKTLTQCSDIESAAARRSGKEAANHLFLATEHLMDALMKMRRMKEYLEKRPQKLRGRGECGEESDTAPGGDGR